MLQRLPGSLQLNKCVARDCSDEGMKPGELRLALVIIKLQWCFGFIIFVFPVRVGGREV